MSLEVALIALRPRVGCHVTSDRVRRYLSALVDTPAPSTAAGAMRVPILNRLLAADGAFDSGRLRLDPDFAGVGGPVIFTGGGGARSRSGLSRISTRSVTLSSRIRAGAFRLFPIACISCKTANVPPTLIVMILNRTDIAWSPRAGSSRRRGRPSFEP